MFTSGSAKYHGGGGAHGAPGAQSQFVGLAMAQASKLWDQQSQGGNVVSSL